MGLEVVLNQILARGQEEESSLLEQAQFERDRILSEADNQILDLRAKAKSRTESQIEALRRELISAAEFEAKRRALVARRELTEDFRRRVLEALRSLPAKNNQALLGHLVEHALKEIPKGTVHARKADLPALTKAGYTAGREADGVGGFQVESADGSILLDYRFETLLENAWKQILSENQDLFEG